MDEVKVTFPEACGIVYARGLQSDYDREIAEDLYLPQSAFCGCRARMKAMSYNAENRVDDFKGFCAVLHREKHGDDVRSEKESLMAVMPEEDVQLATANILGFWNNRLG